MMVGATMMTSTRCGTFIINQIHCTGVTGWLYSRIKSETFRKGLGMWLYMRERRLFDLFWSLHERMRAGTYSQNPVLRAVEIETINRCNNDCEFCPVNRHADTRAYAKMDQALFEKIINELDQMSYAGRLHFYSNNEPLLDVRIADWVEWAAGRLKKARLCLYTNGLLLTDAVFKRLASCLDELVIDNYSDTMELLPSIAALLKTHQNDHFKATPITVNIIDKHMLRTNRSGSAPNRTMAGKFHSPCVLPFVQMVIRPNGDVSMCCNDALGKYTLGNVRNESIQQVWHGDKYSQLRRITGKGRGRHEMCRHCDAFIAW